MGVMKSLITTFESLNFNYYSGWNVKNLGVEDQLLMTLMKLRLDTPMLDLALRFGINERTATNVFKNMLFTLHKLLFQICMATMPSRSKCNKSKPACFASFFNCTQVWDCTEVGIQVPRTNLTAQRMTYSSYRASTRSIH